MLKIVFSPEETASLIPHYPTLNTDKLTRLCRMTSRTSQFDGRTVMSAPPILVTPHEGSYFILNGRHRACCAYARSHNLEAFVAFDMHDLRFHTPQKAFGGYFEGVDEAFNNRWTYIDLCARSGIYNIAQLVNANCNLF